MKLDIGAELYMQREGHRMDRMKLDIGAELYMQREGHHIGTSQIIIIVHGLSLSGL